MTPTLRRTLLATILGSGVVFLDGAIVNLALPQIAASLHTDFAGLQWVIDGYLLSLSALILLGGSLGDIYGRKKIYFIGVVGFAITSMLCGVAPTIGVLVVSRLLQGVFGALMVPGALAIINTNFSSEQRGKAIGQWTAWTSAIVAIGPLVGGYLVDHGSWRWIFFINVPLLALAVWLGLTAIQEGKDKRVRRVDFGGALLAMLGLGGITYGLIEGPARNWPFTAVLALVAGGLLSLGFVWFERRQKDPMLKLDLFKSANFSGANIATFAMYGSLGGFFFVLLIYLQTTVHYSSLAAGLSLLPVTIVLLTFSSKVGAASSKFGPRLFMTIGPILAGIGILLLLPLGAGAHYAPDILPGILLFSIGLALTVTPLTTTILASVHKSESGIASAVNNAVSRVAGLVVIALLGLFGASNVYPAAVILCGVLAIGAGLLSLALVRNPAARAG